MTQFHTLHHSNGDLSRQFVQSMLRAIEKKYGAFISAARKEWERRFAGRDPADACVSVHVSASTPKRKRLRMFPLEIDPKRTRFAKN